MEPLNLTTTDEQELLLRLREGDERAFEHVYQKYSARIFGNTLKLLKDKEAAEDILQEVFIKAWQNRAEIAVDKSFGSYLFTIAKHLVYNYIRRASLETRVASYLASHTSELYRHIEEHIHYQESRDAIQQAIDKLPPKRREVYILCKIQGKSYQEVAEQLGCSVAAVNAHIVKATKSIKEQLNLTEPLILAVISVALSQQV